MSLRERELAWQRRRRFPVWDRLGGPGRYARWTYRHPLATVMLFVVVFIMPAVAVEFAREERQGVRIPTMSLVAVGFLYRHLRVAGELYREWRGRVGDSGQLDAPTGGWLARADLRNQVQAETENEFGVEEMSSPATNRFFALWVVYIGLGVLVGLAVELLLRMTG
jgi:hypothetical protein